MEQYDKFAEGQPFSRPSIFHPSMTGRQPTGRKKRRFELKMDGQATLEGIQFDPIRTGQVAMSVFITAAISVATLILLYSGFPIFGPINDFTNAINAGLSAWLVVQFHGLVRYRDPGLARVALVLAWVGCSAIIINSVLVGLGQMHWTTGAMYTGIGNALLGLWLVAVQRPISRWRLQSRTMMRVGYVAGAAMALGLLAGPALAANRLMDNPLLLVAGVGAFVGWLAYPVWSLKLGRRMLREGSRIQGPTVEEPQR